MNESAKADRISIMHEKRRGFYEELQALGKPRLTGAKICPQVIGSFCLIFSHTT